MKRHNSIDRALKKQKVRILEDSIHQAIADYLNKVIKRPSCWHTVEVSNQAYGRAAMIRQMKLKRKGVRTGWEDIEVLWKKSKESLTQMIFFEVKIPGKDPEPHQLELHNIHKEDGHLVYVVRDVKEVESILKELGVV